MEIIKHWMWQLPDRITDPTVVIDVFSATSNIIAFSSKAKDVFLVNARNIRDAMNLYPDAVVAGEGYAGISFEIPNAFDRVEAADVTGKTVLYMSINGTRAIEKAMTAGAPEVLAGAFANLTALAEYLKQRQYPRVVLIMSGDEGTETVEDAEFASVLQSVMAGESYDWDAVTGRVREFMQSFYWIGQHEKILGRVLERDIYSTIPKAENTRKGLVTFREMT